MNRSKKMKRKHYYLCRDIKLLRQAQMSLRDQWDSFFHGPFSESDGPWRLWFGRKSGLDPKWLIILDLRIISYPVTRPIYGINIFYPSLNQQKRSVLATSQSDSAKKLTWILFHLTIESTLQWTKTEKWIELARLKYCFSFCHRLVTHGALVF